MNEIDFLHSKFEEQGVSPIAKVFLVEDDKVLGTTIKRYLEKVTNLEVQYFESPSDCLMEIGNASPKKEAPFCLITDISFEDGGADGLLLIDLLKEKGFEFVSIAMTGFASIETAINATKKGVFQYLTKPFELEDLTRVVNNAVKNIGFSDIFQSAEKKNDSKEKKQIFISRYELPEPTNDDIFCKMIGRSKKMKKVFERVERVAASDSTVLIHGPSGTGKELVAGAIHKLSPRNEMPLISVNCGAIPSELLESELFGHEKGSFTGAISARKGRFELANKGTIFLDEIGDMPLLLQVKLLRVLQSRVVEKVGSTVTTPIDVRIVTATHRNLEQAVNSGDFREDLYYRLNVIPIVVPSLYERKDDIPLLVSYFLNRFVSADGRNAISFENDAYEALMEHRWPGNVRELENLIERLVILKGGSRISLKDLPSKFLMAGASGSRLDDEFIKLPEEGIDLKGILSEIEDSLIHQALEKTEGNKNRASKLLSMNRTTLIEKLKKKGIPLQN